MGQSIYFNHIEKIKLAYLREKKLAFMRQILDTAKESRQQPQLIHESLPKVKIMTDLGKSTWISSYLAF